MVDFARRSAASLEAERLALIDEASELADIREGSCARDLTEAEQERFNDLTELGGLIDEKAKEVDVQHRVEQNRNAQRAAQLGATGYAGQHGVTKVGEDGKPIGRHRVTNNRGGVIQDDRLAHLTGCFFQYAARLPQADVAKADMDRFGWTSYASMVEGQPASGGYTVPEPIIAEIMRHRDDVGVAMQTSRIYAMTSETLRLPDETAQPTVYYPGEAGSITASDATLQQHTLTAKKRAVLVRASSEVLADSAAAFGDYIVESSAYALANKMDSEYLLGDGTSTYGGELGLNNAIGSAGVNDAVTGNVSPATLDITDWTDTVGTLPGKYHNGAAWIMSREVWNGSVLPLMATSGGAGFAALMAGASAGSPGGMSWLGYPVYFSDLMPTVTTSTIAALFGDFRRAVALGDRNDMRIDTSIDEQFANDLVSFRLLHRYDILVHTPGDDTNAGAYVALKTAAS